MPLFTRRITLILHNLDFSFNLISYLCTQIINVYIDNGIKMWYRGTAQRRQVHDELNFSVLPEEKERMERLVLEEMQGAFALKVPLIADAGWGENWLEAH